MERPVNITVCIPCYNHAPYIDEAFESVLQDGLPGLHVILADDGSKDGSREKCIALKRRYPQITNLILHDENIGLLRNLESIYKSIPESTEYLSWFSGDDVFLAGKLRKQIEFLDNNREYVACYHDVIVRHESGAEYSYNSALYGQRAFKGKIAKYLVERGCFISGLSLLSRWDIVKHLQQRDVKSISSDWLYYIEIAMLGKIGFINEPLGVYRRHCRNLTRRDVVSDQYSEVYSWILSEYPELADHVSRGRLRSSISLAIKALLRRQYDVFSSHYSQILKALRANPRFIFSAIKWLFMLLFQRAFLYLRTGDLFR